jgi:putative molybdopterin biosynthesis protein
VSAPLLRLARQARGLSQQQLARMAGVTRQAVSAVESGHSDPSLRVAMELARALGMTVEELFGPAEPIEPVLAVPIAPDKAAARVILAEVGDRHVALPLRGDTAARSGFLPAGALVVPPAATAPAPSRKRSTTPHPPPRTTRTPSMAVDESSTATPAHSHALGEGLAVSPLAPPRQTLVMAGCDPALPLLETPLFLLDPPVAFAWWPCGSSEALELAGRGLVHAAGVHTSEADAETTGLLDGDAHVVGFSAWREGLVLRPELAGKIGGLDDVARLRARIVNREPGSQARRVLDAERERLRIDPGELHGYETLATGHLQVASAVAASLADAGVASEPAALAYGLGFVPLTDERFDLVLPAALLGSREVQSLLRVLTSPWLATQLASLPGYQPRVTP